MSQKALFLTAARGEFEVGQRKIPQPGPGELLVKVTSAALNPVDWIIQEIGIFIQEYPAVLGTDLSGIVESVGEGVVAFHKGDEVFHARAGFDGNDQGSFQQYVIVKAEFTAKRTSNITMDEAASIPLCLDTAAVGLYDQHPQPGVEKLTPPWEAGGEGLYKDKPILITGGSSSVGQYVIQLARLSGFSPIITSASPRNEALLKSLGATHVIDRSKDLLAEVNSIMSSLPSASLKLAYDVMSKPDTQSAAWDALAPGGTLLHFPVPVKYIDHSKYPDKKVVDNVVGGFNSPRSCALGVSLYKALPALLESGAIKPNRVEVLPGGLNGIATGLARLKTGAVSAGKLVVRPQETV